jgi:SAM-dependent methyltransferase
MLHPRYTTALGKEHIMATATTEREYILGHEAAEIERLRKQSDFYSDITRLAIELAGIAPGMRVLDAGCGPGNVSLLLAHRVGSTGEVIAVDRAPEALTTVAQRAEAADLDNIHIVQDDVTTLTLDAPVDAVFGRLILMHVGDPVAVLRNLAGQVAPGGIVAFQEFDIAVAGSEPDIPLVRRMIGYVVEAFTRAGLDIRSGLRLHHQFVAAGLPAPDMRSLGRVEAAPAPGSCVMLTGVLKTLLPLIEATGVATAADIGIDTLEQRLREEVLRHDAVVVTPPLITAWSRV